MLATLYKKSMPRVWHCMPWRNVIGYVALCDELNGVMNCTMDPCSGQTQSKTFPSIKNAKGEGMLVSSNQKLDPAAQYDVMQEALKLAYQNLPQGYLISEMNLMPTTKNKDTVSSLDLKVTYKICGSLPIQ